MTRHWYTITLLSRREQIWISDNLRKISDGFIFTCVKNLIIKRSTSDVGTSCSDMAINESKLEWVDRVIGLTPGSSTKLIMYLNQSVYFREVGREIPIFIWFTRQTNNAQICKMCNLKQKSTVTHRHIEGHLHSTVPYLRMCWAVLQQLCNRARIGTSPKLRFCR